MRYLVGTDEAGYGPNLGPLVVTATVWSLSGPDDALSSNPPCVVSRVDRRTFDASRQVALADSKVLYSPATGLRDLERGVLAVLGLSRRPRTWREAWEILAPDDAEAIERVPWHAGFDENLPIAAPRDDLERATAIVREGLLSREVNLVAVRSRVVFPQAFNALVEAAGSKGTVLSELTLGLVADVIAPLRGDVRVVCDKHGGRARYGALLQHILADSRILVRGEGRERSLYRAVYDGREIEFEFRARGESELAAAVASMTSKYLREIAMRAFNQYWGARVPNLRPTAGYPSDAVRFRHDIAAARAASGIDDGVLWRDR